jgi:threonine dehydratase
MTRPPVGASTQPVTFEDVQKAAERLKGIAHRTPVMTSRTLDALCGNQVLLKCENFQRMGAFKIRGAYNAMSQLSEAEKRRGVVTYSSGNHAQAIALSGQLLKIRTTIVMPSDAPQVKIEATRGYGAEIVFYDSHKAQREELAEKFLQEQEMTLIPPFDHPHIVAGQGTAARELFEEAGELDYLFVPCGGGGLLSGSAISAKALSPRCQVIGVEPEAGDDGKRSFESGVLQSIPTPQTMADGARTPSLGELTFALIRQHVTAMLTTSDGDLIRTMRFLWERMKIIVEPTGVLGLAPLFTDQWKIRGKRMGVILSGGNVDLKRACELFSRVNP